MAQVQINIDDAAMPRLLDAFDTVLPRAENEKSLNKLQWFRRKMIQYVKSIAVSYESTLAANAARDAAAEKADTEIGVS